MSDVELVVYLMGCAKRALPRAEGFTAERVKNAQAVLRVMLFKARREGLSERDHEVIQKYRPTLEWLGDELTKHWVTGSAPCNSYEEVVEAIKRGYRPGGEA